MEETDKMALARLDERLNVQMQTIFEMLEKQGSDQTKAAHLMIRLEGRMGNLENALSKAQPTIDDYIVVKHKIIGAGKMGSWIWGGAMALITALAFCKEYIINWLSR